MSYDIFLSWLCSPDHTEIGSLTVISDVMKLERFPGCNHFSIFIRLNRSQFTNYAEKEDQSQTAQNMLLSIKSYLE